MTRPTAWQWTGNKLLLVESVLPHIPRRTMPRVVLEPFCGTANMSIEIVHRGLAERAIVRDKAPGVTRLLKAFRDEVDATIQTARTIGEREWDSKPPAYRRAWYEHQRLRYRSDTLSAAEVWLLYRAAFNGLHRCGVDGYNVSSRVTPKYPGPSRLLTDDAIEAALHAHRAMRGWSIDSGNGFELLPTHPLLAAIDPRLVIVYIDPPFPGCRQGDYNGGPVPDWTLVSEFADAWWAAGALVLVSYPIGQWRFRGRQFRIHRQERMRVADHSPVIEHLYVWPQLAA